MLNLVNVGHKSLADYASITTRGLREEIDALAAPLAGKRVLHLSATAFGGGVAEINYTLVPLMADVGLDVEWRIIQATDGFFDVTKTIHNALQGNPEGLTERPAGRLPPVQRRERAPARRRLGHHHRPRRAAGGDDRHGRGLVRPLDLALPHRPLDAERGCGRLPPALAGEVRRSDLPPRGATSRAAPGLPRSYIWPPAIDPLAPKNMALPPEESVYIINQFGIDTNRPLLTQVSRFDPWKDPLGVIDAYRVVKETHPGVQLALVGSMAHDDPEGWDFYNQTVAYAGEDPDIFVLSNLNNVGSVEVNAFQVYSAALIQKSIREGFGLTVSEGLWKARPVVAGRVGGIVTQIEHGVTGWLVDSSTECAEACLEILADPARPVRQRCSARSTCASTSSRRGCSATGSRSSTACSARRARAARSWWRLPPEPTA